MMKCMKTNKKKHVRQIREFIKKKFLKKTQIFDATKQNERNDIEVNSWRPYVSCGV